VASCMMIFGIDRLCGKLGRAIQEARILTGAQFYILVDWQISCWRVGDKH